ncbi:MAG: hypothetical protein A3H36_03260 [Chloroflexi bacterium RIFCSPLOWO2_02_FULL_71_16]|nr:MAG: hypothetical protein A3H36_03260 [Chloroflexi bacterium RIFCSPLOWO2_02_FULL_71_16]
MRGPTRTKAAAALLAAIAGIGTTAGVFVDAGETRILIPALAGLATTSALFHPFPRSGVVTGLLSAAVYGSVRWYLVGLDGFGVTVAIVAAALVAIGYAADSVAAQAEADALQLRHDSLLIEELTPTAEAGALKWRHAQKQLGDEIGRGRRYRYPVSFVLIGLEPILENADDASIEVALRQRSELVKLLLEKTRTSDRVAFKGEDLLALSLPHTSLRGALAFLDKILPDIKERSGVDPRMGVAEFPTDAGAAEELVREAEAALEFARASGLRVVSRSLLMGGSEASTA